ncbi:hypothetical protein M4951_14185 [Blastopirellula sp. J2-11]|uniref:sodium:solute symporter family transporter n=1 Tax=Blastopirellula sp. J2-11 TaxID=2943192 RepID=UPI0021C84717|nr:hypothetical protein [Blastopirellula sp. J2-11]UUO04539.1 hypothetical protein M4951_14185 [Blastopirellula sp. J2-11]
MLGWIDIAIIAIYIAAIFIVGIASRGKQVDEADYFTGGGGFSKWIGVLVVGLSIGATFFSGISMLALPSVAYQSGVAIALSIFLLPASGAVVLFWFLPRFFAANVHQPYEIIERKFGYPTRSLAAAMYMLLRIGWMGVLIYAPVMAIMAGGQLSSGWFWPLVLGIGLTSTIYTTLGGIRGVMVTDAIQFLLMGLGVTLPIGFIFWNYPYDWEHATAFLKESQRLQWVDPSFNVTKPFTTISIVAGFFTANLGVYLADQMSIQRYLAAGDRKSASRAFVLNIVGVVIIIVLLLVLGIALSVWYEGVVDRLPPDQADHVFPVFVATHLPVGTPGLIFAALLAATMSSMTSGINALAGCITLDFVSRSSVLTSHESRLKFARYASILIGVSATVTAGAVKHLGTIFDMSQAFLGVLLGPLLVCMLLSVSKLNVRPLSMMTGMLVGCISGGAVVLSPATSLWVAPTAALGTLLIPLATTLTSAFLVRFSVAEQSPTETPADVS